MCFDGTHISRIRQICGIPFSEMMSHKSVESERRIVSNLRGMPFILRTRQIPHALAPSEPLVTLVSCLGLKGCVVDGHILRGDDCVQRVVIAYFPTP